MTEQAPTNPVQDVAQNRAILKAENDLYEAEMLRAEKLRAEKALAGTGGIRQEPTPPKIETAKEYAAKVLRGGLNGGRTTNS